MPGGKLRPPTGIGPPVVSPAAGGVTYADVSRYCPPVVVHVVGAQVAILSHHVWHCVGSGITTAAGWAGRGIPQRAGKKSEGTWFRHPVHFSRTNSRSRGQSAVRPDLEFHLRSEEHTSE